jgi:hypothetical protein
MIAIMPGEAILRTPLRGLHAHAVEAKLLRNVSLSGAEVATQCELSAQSRAGATGWRWRPMGRCTSLG